MKLFNVKIDSLSNKQALSTLFERQIIFTPNPEILLEARRNKTFRRALKKGTLMLPDGHGLLFVSTLLLFKSKFIRALLYLPALILFLFWKKPFKKIFPEVIHGSDFMADAIAHAVHEGKSVFFLGGAKGVANSTAEFFKEKHSRLDVAGYSDLDPGEEAFKLIKKNKPDFLFVAYGAPKQEIWIAKHERKLQEVQVIMGVGGSFDFYSGNAKRAPKLMRTLGLEWVWRLILNPKSRLKRIWNAFVVFPIISVFSSRFSPQLSE
ncbi:WecB/TagA/CpsF family glycosyltransferase [Candidatus Peregrinibacteria bacterium]|jgi:N-acetylglucosaminyldiphosphoundecaprenol N-acetyl-beta-D-mannosaminyltransferase|nr:WecB/TagA/CpsF family glycosyltransferase [Candidatus Peregrinibacteria bacterium]MBT4631889.1 WecB/TagA/CpsF family glycosyltransferase [Candidatus Peregrinibacteria bacterium]MBT5516699.1 WecB/TagA/CpsF family glycosyltransferase [Candidatus Peregrinibacteria bacterium]MBT5824190.1 WecB/TagA/CpsF family glycosyltransferase [Candidatus Peregrinibacteria bacterium]